MDDLSLLTFEALAWRVDEVNKRMLSASCSATEAEEYAAELRRHNAEFVRRSSDFKSRQEEREYDEQGPLRTTLASLRLALTLFCDGGESHTEVETSFQGLERACERLVGRGNVMLARFGLIAQLVGTSGLELISKLPERIQAMLTKICRGSPQDAFASGEAHPRSKWFKECKPIALAHVAEALAEQTSQRLEEVCAYMKELAVVADQARALSLAAGKGTAELAGLLEERGVLPEGTKRNLTTFMNGQYTKSLGSIGEPPAKRRRPLQPGTPSTATPAESDVEML